MRAQSKTQVQKPTRVSRPNKGPDAGAITAGNSLPVIQLEALLKEANYDAFLVNTKNRKALGVTAEQIEDLKQLDVVADLVSGTAHEINGPLALVMGYSELLLRSTPDQLTREYLQLIFEQAHRACRMVDDLLSVVRHRGAAKTTLHRWIAALDAKDE